MSDDVTTPDDYDASDGYDDERGLECCAHCQMAFGGQSGHHGAVYTKAGRRFEAFFNSDPMDAPLFCPDCWDELDANRRAVENHGLGDFA